MVFLSKTCRYAWWYQFSRKHDHLNGLNYRLFLLLQIHVVSRVVDSYIFLWQKISRRRNIDYKARNVFSNLFHCMIIKINFLLTYVIYYLHIKNKI